MRMVYLLVPLFLVQIMPKTSAIAAIHRATRRYGEPGGKFEQKKVVHYDSTQPKVGEFDHHLNFMLDQPLLALVPESESPKKQKKPRHGKITKTRSRMSFIGL
uniref:Secreted protein n=1 Tax=Steinernema glaseri TaxID=37863 RepID=A0A1I7Y9U4_9BILA